MESTSPSIRRISSDGGGSVWRRICAKYGERGPLVASSRSATHFGLKRRSPGSRYQAPIAGDLRVEVLRDERVGLGQVARLGERGVQRLGVVAVHGHRDRRLARHVVVVEHAHEPEVEEADAAVVEQQVVAGMRVARDAAHVVDEPEVEAEDDLAHAIAGRLVAGLDLLEARAARSAP